MRPVLGFRPLGPLLRSHASGTDRSRACSLGSRGTAKALRATRGGRTLERIPRMREPITSRRAAVLSATLVGALAVAGSAWAHATISPPVAKAKVLQQF